jgi:hypothetical protein
MKTEARSAGGFGLRGLARAAPLPFNRRAT